MGKNVKEEVVYERKKTYVIAECKLNLCVAAASIHRNLNMTERFERLIPMIVVFSSSLRKMIYGSFQITHYKLIIIMLTAI